MVTRTSMWWVWDKLSSNGAGLVPAPPRPLPICHWEIEGDGKSGKPLVATEKEEEEEEESILLTRVQKNIDSTDAGIKLVLLLDLSTGWVLCVGPVGGLWLMRNWEWLNEGFSGQWTVRLKPVWCLQNWIWIRSSNLLLWKNCIVWPKTKLHWKENLYRKEHT